MAKNYTHNRQIVDKLNIKGVLSDDVKTITYINGDGDEVEVLVEKALEPFASSVVNFSVSVKTDEDLSGDE